MSRSIITLTTDFGLQDHFVAAMKGVILGILPTAEIVDVTHQITPFAISQAAFVVAQTYPYYPCRTVHVVVVDPGVGTARRPILVEAAGQFFIGPDNGVFAMVYGREKVRVRHITEVKYFLENVSNTFHGRDIFAPVAAHLRKIGRPAHFGRLIDDYLKPSFQQPIRTGKRFWSGTVLKVDHFGNLITNFRLGDFPELPERAFRIGIGLRTVDRLLTSYAECPSGEPALVEGSSGYLEVVVNHGSAAKTLGCDAGSPVELTLL